MRILAADVGGTKTALCLYEGATREKLVAQQRDVFESASSPALEPLISTFLGSETIDAIGVGIAGPVIGGVCHTTNLPWIVSAELLQNAYNTPFVALHNDVEAAAFGLSALREGQILWINEAPIDANGLQVLTTVGTGFGRATRTSDGRVFAAEGGHASFAPRTVVEIRLLERLLEDHEHVAIEHVISGPGLYRLYEHLVDTKLVDETQRTRERLEEAGDKSALIGELGMSEADPACTAAVHWFCELVGAVLGDIALEVVPRAGVLLWGGVAQKLQSRLLHPDVREAFLDKDRMRALLERVPCGLIDAPDLALLGAREAALRLLLSKEMP